MIDVTISLVPSDGGDRTGLVRVVIWNEGQVTLDGCSDYQVRVSHQIGSVHGDRAAVEAGMPAPTAAEMLRGGSPWVWKRGRVRGFRRDLGVARLLGVALDACGL